MTGRPNRDPAPPASGARAATEWAAAAWAAAAVAAYAAVILSKGVLTAFPRRYLAAALVAAVLIARRKEAFAAALFAAGALALAMIAASGELGPAAVAAAALVLCAEIGGGVRRAAGSAPAASPAERIGVDLPLGVATAGLAVFVLGALRILYPAAIAGVLLAAALVSFLRRRAGASRERIAGRERRRPRPAGRPERFFLGTAIGASAILQLAGAIPPETRYDALNYHLPVPRDWLLAHALAPLPYWHGNFAHLAEAFFVVPMAFGGAAAVKLAVAALTLAVAASAFVLAREIFDARAALRAAALVASIPSLATLAWSAQADSITALFATAAVVCACRVLGGAAGRAEPTLFGILAGAAVGTKLNAVYLVAIPGGALLVLAARGKIGVRAAAAAAVAAALFALPWFAMTWRFTGNPVFPFFNQWFRSPFAGPVNGLAIAKLFGIGTSAPAWLRLPWALTASTHLFGEIARDGEFGPLLLLVPLVLAIPVALVDRRHALVGAAAAGFAVCWAATFQYARYFTVVVPLLAVLVAGAAGALTRPAPRRIMLAAVGAGIVLQAGFLLGGVGRPAWEIAFGIRSPQEYLRSRFPAIDCLRELSRTARPGERVAAVGIDRLRYFVDAPIDTAAESRPFALAVAPLAGRELRDALWERGDRFLLVRTRGGKERARFAEPEFLTRFAEPLCAGGDLAAFRLRRPGTEPRGEAPTATSP